jgi:hypothetical protein
VSHPHPNPHPTPQFHSIFTVHSAMKLAPISIKLPATFLRINVFLNFFLLGPSIQSRVRGTWTSIAIRMRWGNATLKLAIGKCSIKEVFPCGYIGQRDSDVGVMMGGGFNVEAAKIGTSSTSASVNPAVSRISAAKSSKPLVFAVR